jgi:hypothetical protein
MSINLSSKYIKQTALEGTFSATQNIVSFSIPAGMKLDLSECSVLIDLSLNNGAEPNARNLPQFDGVAGIYKNFLRFNDNGANNRAYPNVVYVKNADIRTEKMGQVESLRQVNTLRLALYGVEEDMESMFGRQYQEGVSSDGVGGMNASPFRDIVHLGTLSSRNTRGVLRIPLKDIFDVANAPVWDTNKYGRTDIKLECEFDKMQVGQSLGSADTLWADANQGTPRAIDQPAGLGGAGGPAGAGGVTFSSFKTTKTYLEPETESYFHVGQKLIVQYTITDGGGATQFSVANGTQRERTISQILYNVDNDNKLQITFADGIVLAQGDTISAITFIGADAPASTIVFNKIEMEMKQVADPTPPAIQYTTYSTEEDSGFGGAQTNINKQYTCDGNTDSLVVCPTRTGRVCPDVVINDSRITIDSKEETSEAVESLNTRANNVGQSAPLYYDRISRAMLNMGDDLENLSQKILGINSTQESQPQVACAGLLNPLPLKPQPKQVQLNLNYTAGEIAKLSIYKRMVKQI